MKNFNTWTNWNVVLLVLAVMGFVFPAFAATEAVFDLGGSNFLVMVKTPEGLWFGKHEITQRQWKGVMGGGNPVERAVDEGADKPVTNVKIEDVQAFLGRLNAMESVKDAGFSFRLPTADEWTTACLAGSRSRWPLGADGHEGSLESMAWYRTRPRTSADKADPLRPVGTKAPNAYGLYDMLGNAEEMTATTEVIQDIFQGTVTAHVFCGGGVNCRPEPEPIRNDFTGAVDDSGQNFRDAARTRLASAYRRNHGGFRLCSSTGRAVSADATGNRSGIADSPSQAEHDAKKIGSLPGNRVSPASPVSASLSRATKPLAAGLSPAAGTPTDEQIMAIASKLADACAAQGNFEMANRIMKEARQFIQNRKVDGETGGRKTGMVMEEGTTAGEEKTIILPGGAAMDFVWCPPGSFMMGSSEWEEGRKENETQHRVTLTKGFWMAKTEVTQGQYESVMGTNPTKNFVKADNIPVNCISWYDAQDFCRKTGLQLPTEAQWEYACRAGSTGPYAGNLDEMACYADREEYPNGRWLPVAGKMKPNAWGLHDMHGYHFEWCEDWYGDYPVGAVTNPIGPVFFVARVLRGGCWSSKAEDCRSAYRSPSFPDERLELFSFRPVSVSP